MRQEGMLNDFINDMEREIDTINNNVIKSVISQRDEAYNYIYELEESNDRLIDNNRSLFRRVSELESEKKELLNKVFSLQDEKNNRDRYGDFDLRDI